MKWENDMGKKPRLYNDNIDRLMDFILEKCIECSDGDVPIEVQLSLEAIPDMIDNLIAGRSITYQPSEDVP
jgi:hypothetical protein